MLNHGFAVPFSKASPYKNTSIHPLNNQVMKNVLLICMVLASGALLRAQTVQLPGTGSNEINVQATQVNASTQLHFSNPEYSIIGFTVKFATTTNPMYTASSATDHFTEDMLVNIPQLATGSHIDLQVTLKATGDGHNSWQKSYVVHVDP